TQHFSRVSGTFRHRHHLVATIAFPILSAALLRCLGAKFLSLQCRLHRDRTLCRLSHSARRTAVRSSRVRPLSDPSSPKRRPSNHPNDCPLLHRSRRLRHFHLFFGDHDRSTCAHFLSERPPHSSEMPISSRHLAGITRRNSRVWFQPGATAGHVAIRGLLIAFIATICWAFY